MQKNITHLPAAGDDQVVATGKCILHRIIVGADVASGDIEVSDSASIGDENVQIQLTGATLSGEYEVGALFENGIAIDMTNQTKVTVIWEPTA